MKHCDLLINAEWVIPLDGGERVLEDASVVVTDGRISAIESREKAQSEYQPSATIDRPGHALLPGLVNAHTHAAMTLFRGMADDLPLEDWLKQAIWPAERRWVSAEMVRDGTRLAIAEQLKGGVTCFADHYAYPEIVAETLASQHMRGVVGTPVIDGDSGWAKGASEHLQKASDLLHDPYADHPLVTTAFAPHSCYTLSDASLQETRMLADQLDRKMHIHLHETAQEIEQSIKEHGCRPAERLKRLGLLNSSLIAVHAVHVNDDELRAFKEVEVRVVHCPRSNLKLGSGIAPVAEMLDVGLTVAVGTDGAASNNALDVLSELRFAALLAKGATQKADSVPAETALRMATIDAARVLGLDDRIGSIEAGKWADLTCIDLTQLNTQPIDDPISQIVYSARANQVSDVWVAGRHQLESGELVGIDEAELLSRCQDWRRRMTQGRDDD